MGSNFKGQGHRNVFRQKHTNQRTQSDVIKRTITHNRLFSLMMAIIIDLLHTRVQPRLKSWGGPRLGSQHRAPASGQRTGWVLGAGGSRPLPLWGSRGITPGKFFITRMLNPAFWWLLAVKLLAFWKLRPRSWGTNTLLVRPVSHGPYSCCTYGYTYCISISGNYAEAVTV